MRDIVVCGLPDSVIEVLEQRAAKYGRTLENEIALILVLETMTNPEGISHAEVARVSRETLRKGGRTDFGDAVEDIRTMREERERELNG